jgi:hypothetical protein
VKKVNFDEDFGVLGVTCFCSFCEWFKIFSSAASTICSEAGFSVQENSMKRKVNVTINRISQMFFELEYR